MRIYKEKLIDAYAQGIKKMIGTDKKKIKTMSEKFVSVKAGKGVSKLKKYFDAIWDNAKATIDTEYGIDTQVKEANAKLLDELNKKK